MKGFLFDENVPHRLTFTPSLPVIPWSVHLRFGNLRRNEYHNLLAKMWPRVEALLPAHKLICVYRDRIESFRDETTAGME